VQQAFSTVKAPSLYNALPAIEVLYAAWANCAKKEKYAVFEPALNAATSKLDEYYMKTVTSDAHIIAMSSCPLSCKNYLTMLPPVVNPKKKLSHFKKYWKKEEYDKVVKLIEAKVCIPHHSFVFSLNSLIQFIKHYEFPHHMTPSSEQSKKTKKPHKVDGLIHNNIETDSEYEGDEEEDPLSDLTKPWRGEFLHFLNARDVIPENMGIVKWWGVSGLSPFPTFIHKKFKEHPGTYRQMLTSIVCDYLPIMASSISSKCAFSSAGITISKQCN